MYRHEDSWPPGDTLHKTRNFLHAEEEILTESIFLDLIANFASKQPRTKSTHKPTTLAAHTTPMPFLL